MASKGTIFDIKKFAVHDGPGIRTTVFFKGCPLHCPWCHNPEGITAVPQIMVFAGRCLKGCRDCLSACPHGALAKSRGSIVIDRARCSGCGLCAAACPAEALQAAGRRVSVAEVVAAIAADLPFYRESGGGATFSGGEPLFQPHFLQELLSACRERNIATAVDTSGHAPYAVFAALLPLTDLILFDLKIMDDERHQRLTGVSNRLLLNNLAALAGAGAPLALRIPLVPGVNDNGSDLEELASFCASLPGRRPLHLLPYHRGYAGKLKRLGKSDSPPPASRAFSAAARPLPAASIERAREIFVRHGLNVTIGG